MVEGILLFVKLCWNEIRDIRKVALSQEGLSYFMLVDILLSVLSPRFFQAKLAELLGEDWHLIASDGVYTNVNPAVSTITIVPVNAPPVIDLNSSQPGNNYSTTFTENSTGITIANSDISITDLNDTNIENAVITLTNQQNRFELLS